MGKQINIKYPNGEMNVDLLSFVINHNINDIRLLVRKVIAISSHKYEIKQEVLDIIKEIRNADVFQNYIDTYESTHPFYWQRALNPTKDWQMYNKRLDKLVEFLDKYIKE